jgi:hypothetical protein
MLSGGGQSARPEWYDRNPLHTGINYQATIGPAGSTKRASYIVPDHKKAMVEFISLRTMRASAAGAAGNVQLDVRRTPSGGSQYIVIEAFLDSSQNTVANREYDQSGANFMLLAGDELSIYSADLSTTGAIAFLADCKITEFDV